MTRNSWRWEKSFGWAGKASSARSSCRSFSLSPSPRFASLRLASPRFASLRFALGICWKICTTIELIGLSSGVGFMLHYWFGLFSMTQVFAWTLTFLIVMLLIEHAVLKPLENRVLAWRPEIRV